jgi:hypothetical protein
MIAQSHLNAPVAGLDAQALRSQPTVALMRALCAVLVALCLRIAGAVHAAWNGLLSRDELRELDARTLHDLGLSKDYLRADPTDRYWQG